MIKPANGLVFNNNNIKMFLNITSYITVVYTSIVRKQVYNFTHAISTTFMIKVKNTVFVHTRCSTNFAIYTCSTFRCRRIPKRNVQGDSRNYRKILLCHVRESKMLPNAFPFCTRVGICNKSIRNVSNVLGSSSAANTPPKIFLVEGLCSRARLS